ncbi:MAG: nickel-dependent lactate racemase, partial [Pyrinomonadaceae bacterium]
RNADALVRPWIMARNADALVRPWIMARNADALVRPWIMARNADALVRPWIMASIELKYGRSHYHFVFDTERFSVLEPLPGHRPLNDFEINERLDAPVGTPIIEEIVRPDEKVLIVVPDATREVACGQVINILVRRLIANGTAPFDISVIFATGIHRPVTEEERKAILTPFIAQRIKTLDHRPRDISRLTRLGETSSGIPIELNSALIENRHVILIGGISFHYFAGFTGGRKLICPGLASSRAISATHRLAFDCDRLDRRHGVGTALLDGNPVHEAFVESASKVPVAFCISTIVNGRGELTGLFSGDWIESHRLACDAYSAANSAAIDERRDLVIASCGGLPYDIDLIQAHKSIEAASHACRDGGTIVVLAECRDGLGREDFLKWFDAEDSTALARSLCEKYQVNGQTAWSLRKLAERFDIRLVTDIHPGKTGRMRMGHFKSLAEALDGIDHQGYIIPFAAKTRPSNTISAPRA